MKNIIRTSLILVSGIAAMMTLGLYGSDASASLPVRGFSLTQTAAFPYDAALSGQAKTPAQEAVDYAETLGANHINLTPIATMPSVTSSSIIPVTPPGGTRAIERQRYSRLIQYIHSKKMTVGIRPIILIDSAVASPTRWHGNIQPDNPAAWFESLRSYLDIYANIARATEVEELTIGAELYSMTVGLEDQWAKYPFGFPREWTVLLRDMKAKFGGKTRVMYDINYTDKTRNNDGTGPSGGELERWRYRLVDLKNDPSWSQMRDFWLEIDVVGLDIYRSLFPRNTEIPTSDAALLHELRIRADQYATDIDSKLFDIETAVNHSKQIIIKEVGFKSCYTCFIDPFLYDDARNTAYIPHQALAYQAVMDAFVKPMWPWLMGITFWDIATDPSRSGVLDPGFSPRGKPQTEDVIRKGWL